MYDWSEFEDNDRLLWAYEDGQLYNRIGGKIINKLINLPTFCSQNLTIGSIPFCWIFVSQIKFKLYLPLKQNDKVNEILNYQL